MKRPLYSKFYLLTSVTVSAKSFDLPLGTFFLPKLPVRTNERFFYSSCVGACASASTWKMSLHLDEQCPLRLTTCDTGIAHEFVSVCFTSYLWHWSESITVWLWKHLKGSLSRCRNLGKSARCKQLSRKYYKRVIHRDNKPSHIRRI